MVAERWNGGLWTPQPVPAPVNSANPMLEGVSCVSPGFCFAVGTFFDIPANRTETLTELWNGIAWSIVPSPNVKFVENSLAAVSCATPVACVAVGDFTPDFALTLNWNGVSWALQMPLGNTELLGVSCVVPLFCMAVGNYNTGAGFITVALEWNGTTWTLMPTPNPVSASNSYLVGISCAGVRDCVAVGTYDVQNTAFNETLAEVWHGNVWSLSPTPNPTGFAALSGASCVTSKYCVAVGTYNTGTGDLPLNEDLIGKAWKLKFVVPPATGAYTYMRAVSCVSKNYCVAVGNWSNGGYFVNLSETWNGFVWTPQAPFGERGAIDSALLGVACTSAGSCMAVGGTNHYISDLQGLQGTSLAESWNGTSWSVQDTPNPAGTFIAMLSGVDCPVAVTTDCMAVGSFTDGAGLTSALAEQWNGSTFTALTPPNPTGFKSARLAGVSCPSTSACVAVGDYSPSFGVFKPLTETWNGSSWSLVTAPIPLGSFANRLESISCSSATSCVAVGSSDSNPLAEAWNGTTWSLTPASSPTGAAVALLNGISCSNSTSCLGVGSWSDGTIQYTLAESWNGTAWSVWTTPNPTGATQSELNSVACVAVDQCKAVGDSEVGTIGTIGESFSASGWTLDTTPNPAGDTPVLNGVSCPSRVACVAAGYYAVNIPPFIYSFQDRTLVESWSA